MVPVLADTGGQFPGSGQCISSISAALALSALILLKAVLLLWLFSKILVFPQVKTNIFSFFFPDIGDKFGSVLGAVTQKLWVYQELNAFKLTTIAYS